MYSSKYYVVQDGDLVDPVIKKLFSDVLDIKDFNENGERYNFVGFAISNELTMISFPKHSFSLSDLDEIANKGPMLSRYVRILFTCLKRIVDNKNDKYAGVRNEMNSDYPFLEFFEVYNYFKRYGLFTNEKEIKKFGLSGRISWKDTINKSPKLINNNNLLFLPLIVKENIEQHVFISKCMAYVIDTTLEKFSLFLDGDRAKLNTRDIDFSNKSLIISQLKKAKRMLFKNIHQHLVDKLISFFERDKNRGGNYQLKIYSFHLVWESMVKEYLRTRFLGINGRLEIEWSNAIQSNNFEKRVFYPDIRGKSGYSIEPDYYLVLNDIRYIFDAKYYQRLNDLDYKQISYYFLLKHFDAIKDKHGEIVSELRTYNALILPTECEEHSEVHFELNPNYNLNETSFTIIAYYLNTLKVMESYT